MTYLNQPYHPVLASASGGFTHLLSEIPGFGSRITSSGAFKSGRWIEVDVTAFVTGNGSVSLALTGINSTAVSLASRETGAKAPHLIITTR